MAYRVNSGRSEVGRHGYGLDCGLKCLSLQFMYDHPDREMEKQLRYNLAYQWLCGFTVFFEVAAVFRDQIEKLTKGGEPVYIYNRFVS